MVILSLSAYIVCDMVFDLMYTGLAGIASFTYACLYAAKVLRTSNTATVVINADTRNSVRVVTTMATGRRQVVIHVVLVVVVVVLCVYEPLSSNVINRVKPLQMSTGYRFCTCNVTLASFTKGECK